MSSLRVPRPSRVLCERVGLLGPWLKGGIVFRSEMHLTNMLRASFQLLALLLAFQCATAQQEPGFTSQANFVPVSTLVRDRNGNAVYGLRAQDFIIEDDGVEQPIHLEEAAEAQPISLVVAVQTGRRANREFGKLTGLSSMLDPVLSDPRRQRVLLLISETRDHGSHFSKLDDAVRLIGSTNTLVYTLPFSPYVSQQLDAARGNNREEWSPSMDILEKLAAARQAMEKNTPKELASMTGGEYELFNTRKGFETDMTGFANHLHSRYLLSFEPKHPHPGLHQIRVRLKNPTQNGTVLFRSSYWVAEQGEASQ